MQRGTSPGWLMHRADVFRKASRAGRETRVTSAGRETRVTLAGRETRVTPAGRETSCGQFTAPQS